MPSYPEEGSTSRSLLLTSRSLLFTSRSLLFTSRSLLLWIPESRTFSTQLERFGRIKRSLAVESGLLHGNLHFARQSCCFLLGNLKFQMIIFPAKSRQPTTTIPFFALVFKLPKLFAIINFFRCKSLKIHTNVYNIKICNLELQIDIHVFHFTKQQLCNTVLGFRHMCILLT